MKLHRAPLSIDSMLRQGMEVELLELISSTFESDSTACIFVLLLDRMTIIKDVDRRGKCLQRQRF